MDDCIGFPGMHLGAMRQPSLELDGWCLDDAEQRRARAPDTFIIPPKKLRSGLTRGALAQLLFMIAVEDGEEPERERMWVVVRRRFPGGYLGVLDNDPTCIEKNQELWSGSEIPFEPRHVIDARPPTPASLTVAARTPRRPWSPT
jgi:hypothetical protein